MVVPEINGMQAQVFVTQGEEFHTGATVEIVVAGRKDKVVRNPVRSHVGGVVALITYLGA